MSENTDEAKKVHDAAEQPGNQVAAATNDGKEHHDPYAMGKKIVHPENDLSEKAGDTTDADEQKAHDDKVEETVADQNEVDAKANTPDTNLPDSEKTAPASQDSTDDKPADDTAGTDNAGDAAAEPPAPAAN